VIRQRAAIGQTQVRNGKEPADLGAVRHHQSILLALHVSVLDLHLLQAILDAIPVDDNRPELDDGEQAEHLSGDHLHVLGQVLRVEEGVYDVRHQQKTHQTKHHACLQEILDLVGRGVTAVKWPDTDWR